MYLKRRYKDFCTRWPREHTVPDRSIPCTGFDDVILEARYLVE